MLPSSIKVRTNTQKQRVSRENNIYPTKANCQQISESTISTILNQYVHTEGTSIIHVSLSTIIHYLLIPFIVNKISAFIYIHSPFTNPSTILGEKKFPFSSINLPNPNPTPILFLRETKSEQFCIKIANSKRPIEEMGA